MANKIKHHCGEKFGKLTVVEVTAERNTKGEVMLRCACECGNEILLRGSLFGITKSCGCAPCDPGDHVAGTCLHQLTVGAVKGVHKNAYGRWIAKIRFRGKEIWLGTYDSREEAVSVREKAEAEYFYPVLKRYGRLTDRDASVGAETDNVCWV